MDNNTDPVVAEFFRGLAAASDQIDDNACEDCNVVAPLIRCWSHGSILRVCEDCSEEYRLVD